MLYINLTPFFKLSSKILFVWSCDLSLMLYIVIITKLAVIWSSLTHLSWNWNVYEREKSKHIIYLYLALFGCHKYVDKIMILISYTLCIEILMILWGHPKVITCTKYWLLSPPWEMLIFGACDHLGMLFLVHLQSKSCISLISCPIRFI